MPKLFSLVPVLVLLFFVSCVSVQKEPLVKLEAGDYPSFEDDLGLEGLKKALEKQIKYFKTVENDSIPASPHKDFTPERILESLEFLHGYLKKNPNIHDLRAFIEKNFNVYKAAGRTGEGDALFTGYYVPTLNGSRKRSKVFKYPLFKNPGDILRIKLGRFRDSYVGVDLRARMEEDELLPYYSRTQIDKEGALKGKKLEFLWVDDYLDLFFLMIQGSGQVKLQDGSYAFVNYDEKNGHPYTSLGALLIRDGKVEREDMSLQAIRKYFKENPQDLDHYLYKNESYIFFLELKSDEFPLGCLNVPLTTGRSVAADELVFPKGALAFIKTEKPIQDEKGKVKEWIDFSRFVLDQDKGGAIRGAGRMDIYFGSSPYSEFAAGHMKQEGEIYYLLKKR